MDRVRGVRETHVSYAAIHRVDRQESPWLWTEAGYQTKATESLMTSCGFSDAMAERKPQPQPDRALLTWRVPEVARNAGLGH